MSISLRLSNEEAALIKDYAQLKKMTVSELIRQTILERIEDEIDLMSYNKAMKEFEKDPVTYSHDEMKKMIGIE